VPDCSTRPSQRAPTFAQAARFQGGQVPSASVDGIVCLAKAFPELPTGRLAAMQEKAGPLHQRPKKAPSTVHGPSRRQVLVKVSPILVAFNPADLLDQVRPKLATHCSKLVAQSVSPAYGGFSIATDLVASEDELRFIREGVRSAFPGATSTTTELPSSTSYLKLVDVPITANDRLITPEIVLQQIAKAGPSVRDFVVLQTPPRVIRDSPKSDTATVYLNIADSISGARASLGPTQAIGPIWPICCTFQGRPCQPRHGPLLPLLALGSPRISLSRPTGQVSYLLGASPQGAPSHPCGLL
jgi:hypothetical protein